MKGEQILNPLVSVIITNYNYEAYIEEAIVSVMNQTYPNFELIIVDDGSIDHSAEIIKKYEFLYPDKVRAIFKENGGQGSSFNVGFENAKGEIIALLDADDYWYRRKLETIVHYHKDHDGIQHNLLINNSKNYTILEDKVSKQKKSLESFGFHGTIPTSGLSFKTLLLKDVFPIPEKEYRICADLYLKFMFLNEHDIFSLNTPFGCYRAHDKNQWFNSQDSLLFYYKVTMDRLNSHRMRQGKVPIHKRSSAEALGLYMVDNLNLSQDEKYVLYGTGSLAKVIYLQLKDSYNIVCFSNSFSRNNHETFLDKKIKSIDYLIHNKNKYDRIIIASSELIEIKDFLLEHGFNEDVLLISGL